MDDVRHRRRRADRRRARRGAGRDRERHAPRRLPLDPAPGRPDPAHRGARPDPADLPAGASASAVRQLEKLGVTVRTGTKVVHIDETACAVETPDGEEEDPGPHGAVGGGRARVDVRADRGGVGRRGDGPQRPDPGGGGPHDPRPPRDLRAGRCRRAAVDAREAVPGVAQGGIQPAASTPPTRSGVVAARAAVRFQNRGDVRSSGACPASPRSRGGTVRAPVRVRRLDALARYPHPVPSGSAPDRRHDPLGVCSWPAAAPPAHHRHAVPPHREPRAASPTPDRRSLGCAGGPRSQRSSSGCTAVPSRREVEHRRRRKLRTRRLAAISDAPPPTRREPGTRGVRALNASPPNGGLSAPDGRRPPGPPRSPRPVARRPASISLLADHAVAEDQAPAARRHAIQRALTPGDRRSRPRPPPRGSRASSSPSGSHASTWSPAAAPTGSQRRAGAGERGEQGVAARAVDRPHPAEVRGRARRWSMKSASASWSMAGEPWSARLLDRGEAVGERRRRDEPPEPQPRRQRLARRARRRRPARGASPWSAPIGSRS